MNSRAPSFAIANCSGSVPDGSTLIELAGGRVDDADAVERRSGGGSFDSSTFGPPIGDPLSAT